MNMAALWKLPVVYVCENNNYAVDTSIERAFAVPDIASRAKGFGLPGVHVDGTDVLEVFRATRTAVTMARSGEGPTFLEVLAPRWCGHHQADPQWYYRSRNEVEVQRHNDPIQRLQDVLVSKSYMSLEDDEALRNQIAEEIEEAVRFADDSPWPDAEGMQKHLFAE
jgi:pyruvate dehydrogenase E1 component alpha subunit